MDIKQLKKVHFTGVGGIGISAILRLFASRGIIVSGSDLHLPPRDTLPYGDYNEGTSAAFVPADADLLIYSPAVPESNIERKTAKAFGVMELSYPEALGVVTLPYNTIAISGTHGKSTTTALTGKLFEAGGLDPSVIVGAEVPGWDEHNLRVGKSDIFIVEACEYRRHMLNLSPQAIVLTNLELDHPDYYVDLADIKNAFREYIGKLRGEGLIILNNDDANLRDITKDSDAIIVRFGVGEGADLVARNIKQFADTQTFELTWKGTPLGVFTTTLPGLYNIYNILAAAAVYLAYGGKTEAIQGVLDLFHGVGRRFEIVGTLGNTTIVSDYAHHPTALRVVVEAALARYPQKRVLTIFRPHHRERTIKLFDQFVNTIAAIPHMILVEIYDVPGREEGLIISSQDVIAKVLEKAPRADVVFAADLGEAERLAREKSAEFDVMLVIGAGDADQLAKRLAEQETPSSFAVNLHAHIPLSEEA
jgi:UDP-N-acetylmuramate--alanine ligase